MYMINCKVKGIAPLMQHRFPLPEFEDMGKGGHKQTGARDYREEWRGHLYVNAEGIYQPAAHFEGCLTKAAGGFKIQGKRGATYKELFKASVFVSPDEIPHGEPVPESLDTDGDKRLYLDMRPVVVQRARVVRIRPAFKAGWELEFEITVIDDQIPSEIVYEVLNQAGKSVGVGDHRPKFGRFQIAHFEVQK